jgi:hypothetical protein
MTEQEWLAEELADSGDFDVLLGFLRGKVSDRKLRLFASSCTQYVEDLRTDRGALLVVEVAERFADGLASPEEQDAALHALPSVIASVRRRPPRTGRSLACFFAAVGRATLWRVLARSDPATFCGIAFRSGHSSSAGGSQAALISGFKHACAETPSNPNARTAGCRPSAPCASAPGRCGSLLPCWKPRNRPGRPDENPANRRRWQ